MKRETEQLKDMDVTQLNLWRLKTTAVYHTIVDSEDNLICFMGIREDGLKDARRIIELHNNNVK